MTTDFEKDDNLNTAQNKYQGLNPNTEQIQAQTSKGIKTDQNLEED